MGYADYVRFVDFGLDVGELGRVPDADTYESDDAPTIKIPLSDLGLPDGEGQ